jgi:hypothetical protein
MFPLSARAALIAGVTMLVCATLCACAGLPVLAPPLAGERAPADSAPELEAAFDSGYWVTRPSASGITLIGMAGRRTRREEAVREALLDAARKAALYHGARAASAAALYQGTGTLDYASDFDYRVAVRREPEEFLDALDYDEEADVLEKNGVVVVRVRYAAVTEAPPYTTVLEDGVPDWTRRYTAVIPGFLVGIGFARNRGTLPKTCRASYENALVGLVSRLSARVDTETVDVSGARMTGNVIFSEGDVEGVMILETWVDRRTRAVWTLVAARDVVSDGANGGE